MTLRTVFMGSPDFALPSLQALVEHYDVVGVVTQPDRPAGRGRALTPPPVKLLAQKQGLPTIQPLRLKEPQAMGQLQDWHPEIIVVAAFGQILRQVVLDLPTYGCINVHASLLPHWRGAAPVVAAILHGDPQTGVTIMRMDAGIDTGDILSQGSMEILPHDTAASLGARLAASGAQLLVETLPAYLSGALVPQKQDDSLATYAPMLSKADGWLDFSRPAGELARRVRATHPWPGAYTAWQGAPLKVQRAEAILGPLVPPGQTTLYHGLPAVGAAGGILVLHEVQPAGKKSMPGQVFLQGARRWGQVDLQVSLRP